MFGYIQSNNVLHWLGKINEWITKCSSESTDDIEWTKPEEKLSLEVSESTINKYKSLNSRRNNQPILLSHYFIDLTS